MPLIEIARAASKDEAMAGLERWKARYPLVWPNLRPADVLVDQMRGRSTAWFRIRLNLRNVPEAERPSQEALEVDYDPWNGWTPGSPTPGGGRPEKTTEERETTDERKTTKERETTDERGATS
jgi:bifunctional non-homologous end joining protein LigD